MSEPHSRDLLMSNGTIEILWEIWEPGQTMFRIVFSDFSELKGDAVQPKVISGETAVERYLHKLGFNNADTRRWIKQAKSNGSVRIENVTITPGAIGEELES